MSDDGRKVVLILIRYIWEKVVKNGEKKWKNVYFSKKNAERFSFSTENQYLCNPILRQVIINIE